MPVLYEPDAPEDSFELTPDCNQLLVSGRSRIRITRTAFRRAGVPAVHLPLAGYRTQAHRAGGPSRGPLSPELRRPTGLRRPPGAGTALSASTRCNVLGETQGRSGRVTEGRTRGSRGGLLLKLVLAASNFTARPPGVTTIQTDAHNMGRE